VGAWLFSSFPALSRRRRLSVAAFVLVFLTAPVGRLLGVLHLKGPAASLTALGTTEWMTVTLGALPLAPVVIVAWIARTRAGAPRAASDNSLAAPATPDTGIARRVALERIAGLATFGASSALLSWGAVVGRHRFRVEEVVVRLHGLPKVLDGYTIAQISDIHAGLFVGDREVEEGFAIVRQLNPDLVVATGDLLDFDARYGPWLARKLGGLRGRDGVVGVLGNHDYYAGYKFVLRAFREAGVDMLVNEGRMIRPQDGGGFALLGVDDYWAARSGGVGPDLDAALRMVRPHAARVLLAHQPNYFEEARDRVGLQLSGHTHGGQINPGFRPADWFMRYVAGRYDEGWATLWVNRGFGVAGPPSRIGAPPEVTKVVLVSA
jgi:predicted MPP superfamily phosphohydrolase